MSHSNKKNPNRPARPDQLAYAACAVVVAAVAVLNVLAGCEPSPRGDPVQSAESQVSGSTRQEPV